MKKETKTSHGGKREGSGRKPSHDKILQICIYPHTSLVEKLGGKNNAAKIASEALIASGTVIADDNKNV